MDDFKWFFLAGMVLFICMCINFSIEAYCNYLTEAKAMEEGYIQVDNRWVPNEN